MSPAAYSPVGALYKYFSITEREQQLGSIARSRLARVIQRPGITVSGLVEGDLTRGSFLVLSLSARGAPCGLGIWGMGIRRCGLIECHRWNVFRITHHSGTLVRRRAVLRAVTRRLMAFPATAHGLEAGTPEAIRELLLGKVAYERDWSG